MAGGWRRDTGGWERELCTPGSLQRMWLAGGKRLGDSGSGNFAPQAPSSVFALLEAGVWRLKAGG